MLAKCGAYTWEFFKSAIVDLKCFNRYELCFLIFFASLSIVLSIVDFNHIFKINDDPHVLGWENDRDNGFSYGERIIMTMSGIISFSGALSVVLTSRGKLGSYFWGLINTILYGLFAWVYKYSGDAQLNLFFFLPMQFVGIYMWMNKRDEEETAIPRQLNWWQWIVTLAFTGGISVAFFYEIPEFSKALSGYYFFENDLTPHVLDAVTCGLSVTAQLLLLGRYADQWYFWILDDILQIAMFSGVAGFGVNFNILFMWCLFLVNAFYGLYCWLTYKPHGHHIVGGENTTKVLQEHV